jgi:hypothetical protein
VSLRSLLLALACACAVDSAAGAAEGRFSQSLSAEELKLTGAERLTSDQIAVIDALIRRDLAAQLTPRRGDAPAARFSQRLSDDERHNAGLGALSGPEIERLDALIARFGVAAMAPTLLAPPVFAPTGMRLRPTETRTGPEIHGSISLSYGFGKGYDGRTGGMTLSYEDPARGLAVVVGYSESHIKGRMPLYRDISGEPLRNPLPTIAPSAALHRAATVAKSGALPLAKRVRAKDRAPLRIPPGYFRIWKRLRVVIRPKHGRRRRFRRKIRGLENLASAQPVPVAADQDPGGRIKPPLRLVVIQIVTMPIPNSCASARTTGSRLR